MKIRKRVLSLLLFVIALFVGFITVNNFSGHSVTASARSISFKEGKHILRKAGYSSELPYAKLKSRTHSRTIIWSYPGAQGMDKITLRPYGSKYVKIHVVFGTLHNGYFQHINYPYLPKYKTVRR